jgi:peroxiredoxin Q/BCP
MWRRDRGGELLARVGGTIRVCELEHARRRPAAARMKPLDTVRFAGVALKEMFRRKGETVMLSVGDPAPDFEVKDHRGETVRLSDQKGKTIVLWFYPKADTPG